MSVDSSVGEEEEEGTQRAERSVVCGAAFDDEASHETESQEKHQRDDW